MAGYHEVVHDHFNNPRNVGSLDKEDSNVGSALVGKASCGDVIKLQAFARQSRRKERSTPLILLGKLLDGFDPKISLEIKNTDISSHLKLPPVKIHCSVLAEEAIQAMKP
ncbi:Iron-sulfur cluster assembly protein 1 (AtISU1) (AtIscU1) (Protein ISCU-LIKE 1) (NifU-like N-terminal domain-containing protein ISU1) (NifU-like protein ISU1) [Durusdinium trenchii]|uniref:Iron-sulfur cluster assembly protein 1 (AtISU1) (AtIscU1) (Protein ISCU-LIKE 1) (NifU-like N-terminal domain-containing protein ISU1) (NifU-like protein ISU1) n=1 Tax=Durusdinium trenchii TaxID=1381693 RepID=A0ABP0HBF6_9DINO